METRAWLMLCDVEQKLHACGVLPSTGNLRAVLSREAALCGRWKKWLLDEDRNLTVEEILADETRSREIADLCGHYVFSNENVKCEMSALCDRLSAVGLAPHAFVVNEIKRSLERYVDCFNMEGITGRVLKALKDS